jgi:hypothetical protein
LVSRDRVLLFHDYEPLLGQPAVHVGLDGHNIYDEVFGKPCGAVAWVDHISNSSEAPNVRANVAIFATLGAAEMRVVVETHAEFR